MTTVDIRQASGNLGPSIRAALYSNPNFNITVLTRKSSSATFPSYIQIHRISDDYPESEILSAFKNQDAVVNMAPITEIETHKKIIDAAIKAGVKGLILSEFGTNVPELQTTEPVPIYQGKVEIREYMERREDAGLTRTGMVVGAFFD